MTTPTVEVSAQTALLLESVEDLARARGRLTVALAQIKAKRVLLSRLWDYYNGDHPPLWMTEKIRETFGDLAEDLADNYCELAIDAVLDRVRVTGWQSRSLEQQAAADTDGPALEDAVTAAAVAVWEENDLDLEQEDLYRHATVGGEGIILCEQDPDGGTPTAVVQDPAYCHIEYGSLKRADRVWAVKVWLEAGAWRANVYDGTDVVRLFVPGTGAKAGNLPDSGDRFVLDLDDPGGPHGFDRVPMVPFHRRRGGPSRLRPLVPIQDKINKLSANKMVAAEFGAFRQRWFLTTQNLDDGALTNAPDRAIILDPGTPDAQTQVGEFSVTELANYDESIKAEIDKFFTVARLPRNLRAGSSTPPSGEAIKADDRPFVALCDNYVARFGAAWRDVMDLLGVPADPVFAETTVDDDKTTATVVSAMVRDAGVPLTIALERYAGFTAEEIREVEEALARAGAAQQAAAALASRAFDQGADPAEVFGTAGVDPAAERQRFEALGVAIRAGVDPASAAESLGLTGLEFTGAVPVSLRVPERDAATLENAGT